MASLREPVFTSPVNSSTLHHRKDWPVWTPAIGSDAGGSASMEGWLPEWRLPLSLLTAAEQTLVAGLRATVRRTFVEVEPVFGAPSSERLRPRARSLDARAL